MNWLEISISDEDFFVFEAAVHSKRRFFAALGPFEEVQTNASVLGPVVFERGFGAGQTVKLLRPSRFEELSGGEPSNFKENAEFEGLKFLNRSENFERFSKKFGQIQTAIANQTLQKAVPVEVFAAQQTQVMSRSRWMSLIFGAAQRQEAGYFYAHIRGDTVTLGRSPELLFTGWQRALRFDGLTMALAGTFGATIERAAALSSKKESAEHQFVVNDLVSRLQDLGARVNLLERDVFYGTKLAHLKTPIAFEGALSFIDLLSQLHPSAALGVVPRTAANLDFLDSALRSPLSKSSGFGAPLGFVDASGFVWALVAIRNLECQNQQARVCVGAGVTQDSYLESEFDELGLKVSSTLHALGVREESV